MRAKSVVWFMIALGVLASWPAARVIGQEVAMVARSPRFLYVPNKGAEPVEIDASRSAVLRKVVSLEIEAPTVGRLLAEIEQQTGLTFLYNDKTGTKLRMERPLTLRAESITVGSALGAILYDAGVDVVLSPGGHVGLVEAARGAGGVQGGTIVGRVTDGKTGAGLSGVDVSLEGARFRAMTDAEGRYRLADVTPGSYTVLARRIGYAPERRAVTVTAGQDATADVALQPAATRLGDVVVTAQKREERLQDVPLSVAVVTPEEIDRRGLVSAEDYLRGIPGVNQMGEAYGQFIVIRGIESSPQFQNFGSGGTVATYFGETPTTTSAGAVNATGNVDAKLVDIERVEVLRGPQGTAFGNSSIGGAVRTIPVAPKLDRVEGKVAASYSATSGTGGDNYSFQAVGNFPLLKDKLALRATGYRYEESGFYRNRAGSDAAFQAASATPWGAEAFATDADEIGASRFTGGRIAALFQASDDLRFTLSYLKQKTEIDGYPVATSGTYEQTVLQVAPEHAYRGQKHGVFDTEIDLVNAVTEYDIGWANLLATYSFTESGSRQSAQFGLPLDFGSTNDHRAHVGELRLTTQLGSAWKFLTGLYVEELKDDGVSDYYWYGDPARNPLPGFAGERFIGNYTDRRNLTQKAAFGEASWEFLQGLTLTGGVRAYEYRRTIAINADGAFYGPTGIHQDLTSKSSGTNFRGNLSYKLDDGALLYAGWSEGFRLGRPWSGLPAGACDIDGNGMVDGTNVTIESTTRVDSDNLDSYELGGKFALLDRRLTIGAAVFRMEWSGIPIRVAAPGTLGSTDGSGCGLPYEANAGRARSEGIEFQANVYATDAFRVDVGGSWVRARLTEDAPLLNAFVGDRLPGSPEFNANLGLQYEFKLGGSPAFVRTDPIYVGPFYGAYGEPAGSIPAGDYVKVDVSARVAIRHTNVDLFVRNLTNADDFTWRGATNLGAAVPFNGYRLRPRTIGLQLSRNFNF